jgi:hypothetical protein
MKLYELATQYKDFFDNLDDLPEEAIQDTLEGLTGEIQVKGQNVAAYFQNVEADIEAMKEAEKRIAARRKPMENKVKWLKEYLKLNMERCEITEISCPEFTVKIKKNPPKLVIDNEAALPSKYSSEKVTIVIDNAQIKKDLKTETVEGAHLEQGTRLDVK